MFGFIFNEASLGGWIAALGTMLGVLMSLTALKFNFSRGVFWSIDFALGVMLSAVAFSLIGPLVVDSHVRISDLVLGLSLGAFFILVLRSIVAAMGSSQGQTQGARSAFLLASALVIHNLPEGLASGAAFSGLDRGQALSVVGAIFIQNIPEGFLFVACLKALGFQTKYAVFGGVLSGVVEGLGGMLAGLTQSEGAIFFLMSFAGGAMLFAVIVEMFEALVQNKRIQIKELSIGLLSIPLIQSLANLFLS